MLWYPIISEYLMGDRYFHFSGVIFNGQDLGAVYGELPFWKFFRLLNFGHNQFLNLTHFVWVGLFFSYLRTIVRGIKNEFSTYDLFFCLLMAMFSPIVLNRTMAGHFNLLFGALPFFALLALMYERSYLSVLLSTLGIWFALSTQGYQILAYHVFYTPILLFFLFSQESNKKTYLKWAITCTFIAFLASLPQFLRALKYSADSDNLRTLSQNMVYSYTTSTLTDVLHFFLGPEGPLLLHRPTIHFHEMNYPIGFFLIIFFINPICRHLKIIISISLGIFFLFSAGLFPGDLLAKLPFIKAFRVPQRIFLVPALFLPVLSYVSFPLRLQSKDILLTIGFILLAQILPFYEMFALVFILIVGFILAKLSPQWMKLLMIVTLSASFVGLWPRIEPSLIAQRDYTLMKDFLAPLSKRFSKEELRTNIFKFEIAPRLIWTTVAQSLGIRTIEGYGHPPRYLMYALAKKSQVPISPGANILLIPDNEHKQEALKIFTVDYIIKLDANKALVIEETLLTHKKKGKP